MASSDLVSNYLPTTFQNVSVMIDGHWVMRDRIIPGIDEAADAARAQAQFERLIALYPQRTFGHPPVAAIFSSSYPIEAGPASGLSR